MHKQVNQSLKYNAYGENNRKDETIKSYLDLRDDSDRVTIKTSYRKALAKYHPDKPDGNISKYRMLNHLYKNYFETHKVMNDKKTQFIRGEESNCSHQADYNFVTYGGKSSATNTNTVNTNTNTHTTTNTNTNTVNTITNTHTTTNTNTNTVNTNTNTHTTTNTNTNTVNTNTNTNTVNTITNTKADPMDSVVGMMSTSQGYLFLAEIDVPGSGFAPAFGKV